MRHPFFIKYCEQARSKLKRKLDLNELELIKDEKNINDWKDRLETHRWEDSDIVDFVEIVSLHLSL